MDLIGRRRELAATEQLLDRAAAGTGGHLVVTGPPGSGRTALADTAAARAEARGMPVVRAAATGSDGAPPVWNQLLAGLGADELPPGATPPDLDRAAVTLAGGGPRLLVVDDIDRDATAADLLARVAARLGSGATALFVTAADSPGLPGELRLRALTEPELAELAGPRGLAANLSGDAVHAVWLASTGLPGAAVALARELAGLDATEDALVHLALDAPSRASFLDIDVGLIRLLEAATARPLPPVTRARVVARLARELLGDPSAGGRRRELIDEAVTLARMSDSPGTVAEVLDSALHALWDPAAAHERLSTASQIVAQARLAGDVRAELRGLFWRFTAQMELGDLGAAEAALTAYARAGEQAGDAEAAAMVVSRQAMLAAVRGQFAVAADLTAEAAVRSRRAGLPDAERLVGSLRAGVAALRGQSLVDPWQALARRMPGHFFEASGARAMAESGRIVEAGLVLERLLPAVLAGSGPRWLGVVADLALVASRTGEPASARSLYDALYPYRGRLVVWGGANTVTGPVDDYLGRLATRLGRLDRAVEHLDSAAALEQRIGALPWLAQTQLARADALSARDTGRDRVRAEDDLRRSRSTAERLGMDGLLARLAPPPDEWRLTRDAEDWRLEAGTERARLRDSRGLGYLRALLAAPGQEIPALDLVAGGSGLRASDGDPLLDETARTSYRHRLAELDELLDAADRAGDVERAAALQRERTALLAELRRATGLGGRPRGQSGEAERARVSATRALRAAVTRVASAAPLAGAHLRASLHTGRYFRYQPAPGGPSRWQV